MNDKPQSDNVKPVTDIAPTSKFNPDIMDEDEEAVKVCVRTRPLSEAELEACCRVVAHKTPGEPQLSLGDNKKFTFDQVFSMETQQSDIFERSIKKSVDGAILGFNQTVLAYGQTGSGKTYTMGTGFDVDLAPELEGMIPRAVKYLYRRIAELTEEAAVKGVQPPEFRVAVSFLELYRKNFYDLLNPEGKEAADIKIRDEKMPDGSFQVKVTNVAEVPVIDVQDIMERLRRGSMSRVTERTDMNNVSSRSHAVFTIFVTHRRVEDVSEENPGGSIVVTTSKFNFVDLAGSERLKRTGATGDRAKEGVDINSGLLALGNVISALGDPSKKGSYVPYRDSKLTRMLQDSLGGNSRTTMLACISPCDRDFIETLNTLKYANRARNIRNKAQLNQDSASKQIQALHETIGRLQREVSFLRDGIDPSSLGSIDPAELESIRATNESLKREIHVVKVENQTLSDQIVDVLARAAGSSELDIRDVLTESVELKSKLAAAQDTIAELRARPESTVPRARPETAVVSESKRAVQRGRKIMEQFRNVHTPGDEDGEDDGGASEESEDEVDTKDGQESSLMTPQHTNDLVKELGTQIEIQENLLKELAAKENEITQQRQAYEEKIKSMHTEKEQINAEFTKLRTKLDAVAGSGGESKQLRQQYKREMKDLEKRLKEMAKEAKKRDRELKENERTMDQIKALKQSLQEAKAAKKKLAETARAEAKEARQVEAQTSKALMQLQKQHDKTTAVNKALEVDVQQKSALLEKLKRENEAIKSKLKAADHRANPDAPPVRRSTRLLGVKKSSSRKTRRSVRESMKIAKKDIMFFRKEVDAAVEYRNLATETDEFIKRRDQIAAERKRLRKGVERATGQAADELQEELESVQNELDILTDEVQTRQETLLEMQATGVAGYSDPTDVSEKCEDFIAALSSEEASAIVREFMLMSVAQRLELSNSTQTALALDRDLKDKESLIRSYLSNGKSLSDSQPMSSLLADLKLAREANQSDNKNRASASKFSDRSKTPDVASTQQSDIRSVSRPKSSPQPTRKVTRRETEVKPSLDSYSDSHHQIFERGLRGGRESKARVKESTKSEIVPANRSISSTKSLLTHTHTITGHEDEVTTVSYNGNILLSGSKDKSVRVWDLEAGTMVDCLAEHEYIVKRVIHAGSAFYSASRSSLRIWDANSNKCSATIKVKGDIGDMYLDDDHVHMYVATEKYLRIFDLRQRSQTAAFKLGSKLSQIYSVAGGSIGVSSINNVMVLDNVLSSKTFEDTNPKKLSPPHYDKVLSMTSQGRYLFSGSRDYSIKRWDQNTNNAEWLLGNSITSAHASYVSAMSVIGNCQSLISGSTKGEVKVWDIESCKLIAEASAHGSTINDIATKDRTVFTASSDKTVKIWSYSGNLSNLAQDYIESEAGADNSGENEENSEQPPTETTIEPRITRSRARNGRRMTYTVGPDAEDDVKPPKRAPSPLTLNETEILTEEPDELNRTVTLEQCSFDFSKLKELDDYREDDV